MRSPSCRDDRHHRQGRALRGIPCATQGLLVQGLIKIEESDVIVHVAQGGHLRHEVRRPDAVSAYKAQMQKDANMAVTPIVTVNEDPAKCLSDASPGGLVLVAAAGRIVCDNQLAARLAIVYQDLLPKIRRCCSPRRSCHGPCWRVCCIALNAVMRVRAQRCGPCVRGSDSQGRRQWWWWWGGKGGRRCGGAHDTVSARLSGNGD
ncbi:hypothetical protein JKP88DRAFT_268863 [Tribonema minus]|uniref:Uncharacterized protein n=1 Tax=Tribonema minus TaxID=303371 RepID=A0A835YTY2_9STRA|nr:hypothetical protein JKP88DRAFT_268863 [Tribonema minus]